MIRIGFTSMLSQCLEWKCFPCKPQVIEPAAYPDLVISMVILSVTRSTKQCPASILCGWYDREHKVTDEEHLPVPGIKFFDWYHPS